MACFTIIVLLYLQQNLVTIYFRFHCCTFLIWKTICGDWIKLTRILPVVKLFLWCFSVWINFSFVAGHPEPRQLYGISQYKKFIFIIGGEGRNGKLLNDVWRLDLDRNCWKGFGNVLPVDTTPESLGWHLSTITEVFLKYWLIFLLQSWNCYSFFSGWLFIRFRRSCQESFVVSN